MNGHMHVWTDTHVDGWTDRRRNSNRIINHQSIGFRVQILCNEKTVMLLDLFWANFTNFLVDHGSLNPFFVKINLPLKKFIFLKFFHYQFFNQKFEQNLSQNEPSLGLETRLQ